MNFRRMFIILLLPIALIVSADSVFADAITLGYIETNTPANPTLMRWDFRCSRTLIGGCVGTPSQFVDPNVPAPPNPICWTSAISVIASGLRITSQHTCRPHILDVGPGEQVTIDLPFRTPSGSGLLDLPVSNVATRLAAVARLHPAIGGDRQDFYEVFVIRNQNDQLLFTFSSQHVPEPLSVLLLGTGLAGVVIKTRKGFKGRKSSRI